MPTSRIRQGHSERDDYYVQNRNRRLQRRRHAWCSSATLEWPTKITLDPAGNIVFADSWNARVRKIDITTAIITIAGNGVFGNTGDRFSGNASGLRRWGVIYDSAGNLYISDSAACVVRVVNSQGIITTFAGTGKRGSGGDGGPVRGSKPSSTSPRVSPRHRRRFGYFRLCESPGATSECC